MVSDQYHFYNRGLREYANSNRKSMTKAEACLWKYVLSNRKMMGYQFRRQRPVLSYIADFMCKELYLIIEVDGIGHQWQEVAENDIRRTKELEKYGFRVIRISNQEVLFHVNEARTRIEEAIKQVFEIRGFIPPPGPRLRGRK